MASAAMANSTWRSGCSLLFNRNYDRFGDTGQYVHDQRNKKTAAISAAPDGSFIVTWRSWTQPDGSSWDAMMQRFDAAGNKIGTEQFIHSSNSGEQREPRPTQITWDKR
jgi:hypothetical protein